MKIFIGLAFGILTGLALGEKAVYLRPLGTLFLNLINMVIVLLIFSSMIVGVNKIHDPSKLGRVGGVAILIYFCTTLVAIALGMSTANFAELGSTLSLHAMEAVTATPPSIGEILTSIVPSNPIAAMANGNILQVIVFALFIGISINFAGEKGKPLLEMIDSLSDVMFRLTSIIMEFSPFGVFGIMAWVTGTFGLALLIPLVKFLLFYCLVCLLQILIVYYNILKFGVKMSLWRFLAGMRDALIIAFTTCSSAASLPVAMNCAQDNLGVSKNISSFVFPLGLTFNMNGTAIFQVMSAIFLANAYGIDLDLASYVKLILTTFLSAIGTAGVPGGGFIMLSAVLTAVGIPLEGLAIVAGIDRIREMFATFLNIFGDSVVTLFIAHREGEIDLAEAADDLALST